MAFAGFPESGLAFLRDLSDHNDRDWFEAHRSVWDQQIVPAMLEWCATLADRLKDVMPRLVFLPRVGGSLYRLNRDIRFSRDKRPYKTHVAALLWEGGEKHDAPGVYLHVSAAEVIFGPGRGRGARVGAFARLDARRALPMIEPVTLRGRFVVLRPLARDDLPALRALAAGPRGTFEWAQVPPPERAERYVENALAQMER